MADGNVTLYGQVNVVGAYVDDGTTKTIKVDNAYTSSRLGFRGEEDLGDGLKAYFQIEQGIRPDDGTSGNFASREGWVGLQGSFGKLGLGRGKTPYTNMADWFDGYSDSGKGLPIYDNKLVGATAVLDSRFNNTVRYDSPSMSGFGASVAYSAGENKDDSVTRPRSPRTACRPC
ncbi:porin [Chitinimonas koreensis]|uniref:porin n=1 Tax=Chitinimonas koreensis TaxID=356302 RepID=UPI001654882C|nr:porin [Chitinimonas koreensis]QNM95189.1 porin [Chitinimonas koreensis]